MINKGIVTIAITFIIVFAISFYIIDAAWPTEKTTKSLTPIGLKGYSGGYDLSQPSQSVAPSDIFAEPFFASGGGSLVFYIYLTSVQRTPNALQEYTDVVGVPGSFSLQVTQGSSRFKINTQHLSGTTEEHIDLPKLPERKWVQIAILREGRRIDVVYNNKTVASQRLHYIPIVRKNTLVVGASGILGIAGNFRMAGRRISIREVIQEHTATSDTRGKPYVGVKVSAPTGSAICSGPSCNTTPATTTTPQNTLQFWSSPYR